MRSEDGLCVKSCPPLSWVRRIARIGLLLGVVATVVGVVLFSSFAQGMGISEVDAGISHRWLDYFPPSVVIILILLLSLSAFFSSSETAFLAIQKPRLRMMRDEDTLTGPLVARMIDHPGRFLTTVLVGNTIVNTIIGVVLGTRVKDALTHAAQLPPVAAYVLAAVVGAGVLVLLGDIVPKILAVRSHEAYARVTVFPLMLADRLLAPVRDGFLRITNFLFKVTRFNEFHAAPYITDEELKSMLSQSDTRDAIEEEDREMIRRILDFRDVQLREILVPRPDLVAVSEDDDVAAALAIYQQYEYSRLPVYKDDLDHITGILFAKDLISSLSGGDMVRKIKTLARPPHFVPETMSVQGFVKDVQRLRSHLAVVVDEYGGTRGIVTLHDAVEQVVGDIQDEFDEEEAPYERISAGVVRVEGSLSLDRLSELIGVDLEESEHQTVAGFLMDRSERVPEVGDVIYHGGITFTVEAVKGKRVSKVRIDIPTQPEEEETA